MNSPANRKKYSDEHKLQVCRIGFDALCNMEKAERHFFDKYEAFKDCPIWGEYFEHMGLTDKIERVVKRGRIYD